MLMTTDGWTTDDEQEWGSPEDLLAIIVMLNDEINEARTTAARYRAERDAARQRLARLNCTPRPAPPTWPTS
jgi:hypothetical protein